MRPYPDELLRSVRHSLTEVLMPDLGDDWARYVAKGMEKILLHLEVRWRQELDLVARDAAELDGLLRGLRSDLAAEPFSGDAAVAGVLAAAARPLDHGPPPAPPDVDALYARQAACRAALVEVIETMERAAADAGLRVGLEPYRERIRASLRRELDGDLVLTEPTFMLFGPPTPAPAVATTA